MFRIFFRNAKSLKIRSSMCSFHVFVPVSVSSLNYLLLFSVQGRYPSPCPFMGKSWWSREMALMGPISHSLPQPVSLEGENLVWNKSILVTTWKDDIHHISLKKEFIRRFLIFWLHALLLFSVISRISILYRWGNVRSLRLNICVAAYNTDFSRQIQSSKDCKMWTVSFGHSSLHKSLQMCMDFWYFLNGDVAYCISTYTGIFWGHLAFINWSNQGSIKLNILCPTVVFHVYKFHYKSMQILHWCHKNLGFRIPNFWCWTILCKIWQKQRIYI